MCFLSLSLQVSFDGKSPQKLYPGPRSYGRWGKVAAWMYPLPPPHPLEYPRTPPCPTALGSFVHLPPLPPHPKSHAATLPYPPYERGPGGCVVVRVNPKSHWPTPYPNHYHNY